jgi:hypothetical protein
MDIKCTNGVSFGARYTVQSSDVGIDAVVGVAEIIELTVTDGAVADGTVDIVLRGADPVSISVQSSDDTPEKVATQIASGTYPGWAASATDAVVTFTAEDEEAKEGINSITGGDTEVDGTFDITTPGVDAEDAIPGEITFVFKGVGDLPVNYDLASSISIVNSSNVNQDLSDAKISYPAKGKVKIEDGTTFKLTAGQKISVIAQRAN